MKLLVATLLAALPTLVPSAPAQDTAAESGGPKLPKPIGDRVHSLLLAGGDELAAALGALGDLREGDAQRDGTWQYLEALTLARQGKTDQAARRLELVIDGFPGGPYESKARFQRAELLMELGRFDEAQTILDAATVELRASDRRDELVTTCLDLVRAETAVDPDAPRGAQDEGRLMRVMAARSLLTELHVLETSAGTRRELLRLEADLNGDVNEWAACSASLGAWLELAGDGPDAPGPDEVRAVRLEAARAMGRAGRAGTAKERLDLLAVELAEAGLATTDLAAEVDLERAGLCRRIDDAEHRDEAIAILERHLDQRPAYPGRTQVAFDVAELELASKRTDEATEAWQRLLDMARPGEDATQETRERDLELRMEARWRIADLQLSWAEYDLAIAGFSEYIALYPSGPRWGACQAAIIDAEHDRASDLADESRYLEARLAWRAFLEDHPVDPRVADVQRELADSFGDEAHDAEQEGRDDEAADLWRSAIDELERIVRKSPGSDEASSALYRIGRIHEDELDDLSAAISAYRRCDFGEDAWRANNRLAAMLDEQLSVSTRQVWRPGTREGAPSLRLVTRNLSEVEVELYRLDLESYFRRHRTHRNVADLDLDLIQADRVFTHTVDVPQTHALVTEDVPLPIDGPGAWVVVAVSEEERATTLVLASDLELVVESNASEALVLVQDRVLRAALPNARVLVSIGGSGPLAEAVTGPDGVARIDLTAEGGPRSEQQLAVLVESGGHLASTGLALPRALDVARPAPAAFVHTDRGTYRAGDRVHWRAILRDGDTRQGWTFEPGRMHRVSLSSPGGTELYSEELALGAYGTLNGSLALPEAAERGTYRLTVTDDAVVHHHSFVVADFEVPRTRLAVEPGALVLLPGQTQTFELVATYAHGAPLAGARLVGHVGRSQKLRLDLVTDAEGRATCEVDLAALEQSSGSVPYDFRLVDEGQGESGLFYLAAREFSLGLSSARTLVLADEAFGIDVRTTDLAGEPTARHLELRVVRHERDARGQNVTVLVHEQELDTDDAGHARIDLTMTEGGRHDLRVSGLDALGNPVRQELTVEVSADDDDTRLRFLVERTRYQLGQDVALRLHNRSEPGPALVVFEGDGILDYRVVDLTEGDNELAFTAAMGHWPNTTLRVDLIGDERLHRASQEIWVERGLSLELETGGETFAPGATAELALRLVDGLGQPVQGQFSLALVDAAFVDRYGDPTGDPREVFEERRRRKANLAATTSAGFVYSGVTRTISAAVLAEVERARQQLQHESRLEDARNFLAAAEDKAPAEAPAPAQRLALGQNADSPFESEEFNDLIGVGGGAGGSFGGRRGGRKNLRAAGGSGAAEEDAGEVVTAFWRGDLTTDAEGHASVSLNLPDRGGAWRLSLVGVDRDARTARVATELVTSAALLVDLELPGALREGDSFGGLARVHHTEAGTVHLRLDVSGLGDPRVIERHIEVDGPGSHTVDLGRFDVPADAAGFGTFRLSAVLDDGVDVDDFQMSASDVRRVAVRPYGVRLSDSAAGYLDAPRTFSLGLAGGDVTDAELQVHLGADLTTKLLAAALGRESMTPRRAMHPSTGDLAQDLLGAAELLAALEVEGSTETGELRRRVRALVAELLVRQEDSGGWAWAATEHSPTMDPSTGAWGLLALEAAARVVEVPAVPRSRASGHLLSALSAMSSAAEEPRALVLHALASAEAIDQDKLAGLFRTRDRADATTLAHLALAYRGLGRGGEAAQLGQLLDGRLDARGGFGAGAPWCRDDLRTTALGLWALSRTNPEAAALDPAGHRLLEAAPWGPGRRRGLAVAALASQVAASVAERGDLRVTLAIEGQGPRELVVPRGSAGRTTTVRLPDYAAGTDVQLTLAAIEDGRRAADWRPTFHATLTAWDAMPERPDVRFGPAVKLHYSAAPPRLQTPDGAVELATGFSILGVHQGRDEHRWENLVTQLPLGQRVRVHAMNAGFASDWQGIREHHELELPLPAGTTLVPGSLQGAQLDWSLRDGSLFLRQAYPGFLSVRFDLIGTATGTFRVPPPRTWSAEQPDEVQLGFPSELTILPLDATSSDPYQPTPDELFDRGTRLYDAGDLDGAHAALAPLHQRYDGLFDDRTEAKLAEMLLTLSIRSGDAAGTVAFFESLTEHDPSHFLTLDEVVAIGRSYRDLGEHERAARLFQATLAESFSTDLRLAGALDRFGDLGGSLDILDRLWREYPDLPAVIETRLALTDQLLTRSKDAGSDPELVAAGRDRVALVIEATLYLREFLALYPEHSLASDAGMNLIQAYLDLEDHARVERLSARLAARFTEPKLRDEFRYTRAVASWYQDEVDTALELLSQIVSARYPDERGREVVSANRDLALFLSAQIYHADGELEKASGLYGKVKDRFSEAAELLTLFDERRLALPEVTRVAPEQVATLALEHKGLERVELQLFPVDLMTLYLREGNLEDISGVNLAGISPVRTEAHDLDAPLALDTRTTELTLGELEPGAYLAILRGEGRFTSGLVLVTDLELVVREDSGAGAVRVEVRRGDQRLPEVDVRVVGSFDGVFRSGETDRRGLYTASGISGTATVIARLDRTTYAFHRGTIPMGEAFQRGAQTGSSDWFLGQGPGDAADEKSVDWFEGQMELNSFSQGNRRANLEENWNKKSKGVQVQKIQ